MSIRSRRATLHRVFSPRTQYLPIGAAVVWFITLFILLIYWLAVGRPRYSSQEGAVAFISDVGAQVLKPLFVVGCVLTSLFFLGTLLVVHLIHAITYPGRIQASDAVSPGESFDTLQYRGTHQRFLAIFALSLFIGVIASVVLSGQLFFAHRHIKWLKTSFVLKLSTALVLISVGVAFVSRLATTERGVDIGYNQAGILEWTLGLIFVFYVLTFWYDLRTMLTPIPADRGSSAPQDSPRHMPIAV
ncbi:SubName: Full=Uncharacterized protein {ECO:0000313/EMBL:CCA73913.1} [Serendipita indica DSM 11827]|nr:SubName: Full=Uncharacterized protein {ECO:0000313/EMBL:CCA73913.1} [Serendipita indica DSM 11827]